MIFTNTEETLEVICGDTENPCNLNIKINKGLSIQKDDYLDELYQDLQNAKESIIRDKLDLLYKFDSQDNILELFETTKTKIKDTKKLIDGIKQTFSENVKKVENTMTYNEKKAEFYISLDEYKTLLKSYLEEPVNPEAFLRDAIEVYNTKLVVLQEEMRKLSYRYYGIDIEKVKKSKTLEYVIGNFYKQKYGLEDTEFTIKDEKQVTNKK